MADEMMTAARIVELEGLLRECGEQFRFYEASHLNKIAPGGINEDASRKAEVNAALAARVESLLRGETIFQPADTAPDDASDLVLAVITTCDCKGGPGLKLLTMGSREGGEWVHELPHYVDVVGWAPAPAFPEILMGETRQ